MNDETLKKHIIKIMHEQKYAVIATQAKKGVYTNLVAFCSSDNLKNIYFATSTKSNKYVNLVINPYTSILIDDRENTTSDIINATAITALGKASNIDKNNTEIKDLYLKKHPQLNDFIQANDSVFIKLNVDKYIYVNSFENIHILHP
jgi:general stress protein 26